MSNFFSIIAKGDHRARAGVIHTAHGDIPTPSFVPVGTKATVKSITPEMLKDLGADVMLANTYHLYLQPGDELIRDAGGFANFMNWNGPTMTDSGGFQVFSLGAAYGKELSKVVKGIEVSAQIPERSSADDGVPRLATIGNDGVSFRSHIDGSLHYITPEKSMEIQHNLGADIIFAFDECTSPSEDLRYQKEALDRTHAWGKRCLEKHKSLCDANTPAKNSVCACGDTHNFLLKICSDSRRRAPYGPHTHTHYSSPALFGVIQGGRDENLRKQSAQFFANLPFDGFGIGGSFAKEDMSTAVEWVNSVLPEDKPRHLLGIGEPEDLFMGVENGVDLFDCVAPTRNARNGTLYTNDGKINMMNAKFQNDFTPVMEGCKCYTCTKYTRAYVSHLFRAKEMLAGTLSTIHNLYFIVNLVKAMREKIIDGTFSEYKEEWLRNYKK